MYMYVEGDIPFSFLLSVWNPCWYRLCWQCCQAGCDLHACMRYIPLPSCGTGWASTRWTQPTHTCHNSKVCARLKLSVMVSVFIHTTCVCFECGWGWDGTMALNVGLEGIRLGPLAICLPHWQSVCRYKRNLRRLMSQFSPVHYPSRPYNVYCHS